MDRRCGTRRVKLCNGAGATNDARGAPRCGQSNTFQRVGAVHWRFSTAWRARGARFAVAQDARRDDPGLKMTRNPGNVGLL